MSERTYSIADAARELGVTRQTIYRWIAEGRLTATEDAGGKLRVTAASVEKRPQKRQPYEKREEGE